MLLDSFSQYATVIKVNKESTAFKLSAIKLHIIIIVLSLVHRGGYIGFIVGSK